MEPPPSNPTLRNFSLVLFLSEHAVVLLWHFLLIDSKAFSRRSATMSDKGEKTCPLCAEEMDLTDQQLKPCKCGYEICVWCWHHIMEMAEKDDTQGRCPACRTPYNKEKIVGMTSKCERLVSEMNVEKKLKSQKGKIKTSEGRKQLGSVRVIQKNLVYVVGLPFHLADEEVLQRKEYFGQYGKVLKVSISRTTTGAIQNFPNNTCSVYITYSKEEEAIRCIQLVDGFVLDGRPLRACFGTTKYCHAWLRNAPCSNPDCLYLHEIGSQEDSFTKDEVISSHTRNRVQQIMGATNSTQRHSGSALPSPVEDISSDNNSAFPGKPTGRTAVNTHNITNVRFSPPNSSSGRSAALPTAASWGTRPSSYQSSLTSTRVNVPPNQKLNVCDSTTSFAKVAVGANQVRSFPRKKVVHDENTLISQDIDAIESSEPAISESNIDVRSNVTDFAVSSVPLCHFPSSVPLTSIPTSTSSQNTSSTVHSAMSLGEPGGKDIIDEKDGKVDDMCSAISSVNIHVNGKPQNGYVEHIETPVIGQMSEVVSMTEVHSPGMSDFRFRLQNETSQAELWQKEECFSSLTIPRSRDPDIAVNTVPDVLQASKFSDHSSFSPQFSNADGLMSLSLDNKLGERDSALIFSNRHPENVVNSQEFDDALYSKFSLSKETRSLLRGYEGGAASCASEMGESSIISNILSMDPDSWNESLASPQNLAKLFGEEKQVHSGVINSRKNQSTSQSRFAFAREDGLESQVSDFGQSSNLYEDVFKQLSSSSNFQVEKYVHQNNLPVISGMESDIFASSSSQITPSKHSASRCQISAPPGFSMPSRLPPPGFSSIGTEHFSEAVSGSHMPDDSLSLRNQYQASTSGNTYINGDIEFIDPAILAVGKGIAGGSNSHVMDIRSSFPSQFGYEDPRIQSIFPRSVSPYDNYRFNDERGNVSSLGNAFGTPSRILEQRLSNNTSPFSQFTIPQSRNAVPPNGLWDGWNDARSVRNLDASELFRNNDIYTGHEDSKIRFPSSDGFYNGVYRL